MACRTLARLETRLNGESLTAKNEMEALQRECAQLRDGLELADDFPQFGETILTLYTLDRFFARRVAHLTSIIAAG